MLTGGALVPKPTNWGSVSRARIEMSQRNSRESTPPIPVLKTSRPTMSRTYTGAGPEFHKSEYVKDPHGV